MWPGGHAVFGQKLLNTQHGVGRCARKSPIMKWANMSKESSEKLTEAECSLSQQPSWCTDTDGFLEHLPGGGKPVLQGACPPEDNSVFLGPPSYIHISVCITL